MSDIIMDELKTQSNLEINAERRYYTHNQSLDAELEKEFIFGECDFAILDIEDKSIDIEQRIIDNETNENIMRTMMLCTTTQKRRFISYFYDDISLMQISIKEGCSEKAIRDSIKYIEKKLTI